MPADITNLLDRPIAFHRLFVQLTGSVTAALMLSQALYWQKRCPSDDGRDAGWWYKSRDDWSEETGLTRREQETARKKLVSLGLLQERLAGNPARLWYFLDGTKLTNLLGGLRPTRWAELDHLDGTKPPNSHYTETTTERGNKRARKRATTLPDDFTLTEAMKSWAHEYTPRANVERETAKFRDYHTAKGSTFKCWNSAWHNWMRNAEQYAQERAQKVPAGQAPRDFRGML
jgi:hypothetical protein